MELNRANMLRAYPAMPDEVRRRVEATLSSLYIETKTPPVRRAQRLRFATVLVIALLLTMAAAVAAGIHFGVFDFMAGVFGHSGVLPEAGQMVQQSLASVELPHTTLKVEEAVYDGGSLRVVYAIGLKDGTPIAEDDLYDQESPFWQAMKADELRTMCDWFFIDGQEVVMTGGSTYNEYPDPDSGKLLCYMDIQLASSGIVPEGDFTMALPLMGAANNRRNIEFTVKAAPPQATLPSLNAQAATVTVMSAAVTPVRVRVTLRVEMDADATATQYLNALYDWEEPMLVDGSGKELALLEECMPGNVEEGKSIEYSFTFLPTDASEVYLAPITFDDDDQWMADMSRALRLK